MDSSAAENILLSLSGLFYINLSSRNNERDEINLLDLNKLIILQMFPITQLKIVIFRSVYKMLFQEIRYILFYKFKAWSLMFTYLLTP